MIKGKVTAPPANQPNIDLLLSQHDDDSTSCSSFSTSSSVSSFLDDNDVGVSERPPEEAFIGHSPRRMSLLRTKSLRFDLPNSRSANAGTEGTEEDAERSKKNREISLSDRGPPRRMELLRSKSLRLDASDKAVNVHNAAKEEESLARALLAKSRFCKRLSIDDSAGVVLQKEPAPSSPIPLRSKDPADNNVDSPQQHLDKILMSRTGSPYPRKEYNGINMENFFIDVTNERVHGFGINTQVAVRADSIDLLATLDSEGQRMDGCNKFGESIIHLAARKGSFKCLEYLVHCCQVDVRVCCDAGRNPLHDACWSAAPNFDVAFLLIKACPDLLHVRDKRGHTPLEYIPRDVWSQWNSFLDSHAAFLRPRVFG